MNEFEKNLPKDKVENLRKLTAPNNENIRQAERNKAHRNKGTYQTMQYINDENTIEALSQPTRRFKSASKIAVEGIVTRTGKPFCSEWGMTNPVKLNLSSDTERI